MNITSITTEGLLPQAPEHEPEPEAIAAPESANTSLTDDERRTLVECERQVEDDEGGYLRIGRALTAIRDGRLYRDEHRSFERYALHRFRMSKAGAYRFIDAVAVYDRLAAVANEANVSNLGTVRESALRPLCRFVKQPSRLREALVAIVSGMGAPGGRLTARSVEATLATVVQDYRPKTVDPASKRLSSNLEDIARKAAELVKEAPAEERWLVASRVRALVRHRASRSADARKANEPAKQPLVVRSGP